MEEKPIIQEDVFPKGTNKSYALVELVRGKSSLVGTGPDDTVFSFPVVLLLEIVLFLGVTLGLFLFSLFKQAPLGAIANPQITTNPAKAPWYFVGLQELLEHMHPTLAGVVIPGILVLFLISLPYLDQSRAFVGIWFSNARGKRIAAWTALYTAVMMPAYIILDNTLNFRESLRNLAPGWVSQWMLPIIIFLVLIGLPMLFLRRSRPTVREYLLMLFTILIISAIVFTLTGFLFRGPSFKLYWPWEMPGGYNPWDEL